MLPHRRALLSSLPVGPLDLVPGAAVAYSVARALSRAYRGQLIRVRRASDNAELDFYALGNGQLDTGAVAAFIFGTTGFITTLYDQSGNARNATQATAANQPAYQTDKSALFDGANDFLKAVAFTLNQPETIYLYGRAVTWSNSDIIYDGESNVTMALQQITASPQLRLFAGSGSAEFSGWILNTYGVLTAIFNGVNSLLQVNNGAPTALDAGTSNAGGFQLGRNGGASVYANVQVKEVVIYPAAHSASQRALLIINQMNGP